MTGAPCEKLVDRVRKLLALAGNNPNPEESEAALLKAQRMMAEHGVAQADLEVRNREVYHAVMGAGDTPPPRWVQKLTSTIALNFRCASLVSEKRLEDGRSQHKQILMGLEEDLLVARYVFDCAADAALRGADQYVERENARQGGWITLTLGSGTSSTFGSPTLRAPNLKRTAGLRNDFLLGWVEGLAHKFRRQVRTCTSTAIMVSKPPEVKKVLDKLEFQSAEVPDEEFAGSLFAQAAGAHAGMNFEYAKPVEEGSPNGCLPPADDDDQG